MSAPRAALLALATLSSGCFTSWAITQGTGTQRVLDEGGTDESVPLPDTQERLTVRLPLTIDLPAVATSPTQPQILRASAEGPLALTCAVDQAATNEVAHAAFRYGKKWKLSSGLMFLAEAGFAALFLLTDPKEDKDRPAYRLAGALLAADAVGTAAIFFIPRKEVFRTDRLGVITSIRTDCPEGMTIAVGAERFPIDAAGSIGAAGTAALDAWMQQPQGGPVTVALGTQIVPLQVSEVDRCTWNQARHQERCYAGQPVTQGTLVVPVGTLSSYTPPTPP